MKSSSTVKRERSVLDWKSAQAPHLMVAQTEQSTIRDLARNPQLRGKVAGLILLLTLNAGWTDLLGYLFLGRIFPSFMTGNVLFVGLGVAESNYHLLASAIIAILANISGVTIGSSLIHRAPASRTVEGWRLIFTRTLLVEWCLLFVSTALLLLFSSRLGSNYEMQIIVLFFAALAMGIQGGLVIAFELSAIVANALTAVVIILGQSAGEKIDHVSEKDWRLINPFRVGLLLCYALGAIVVGFTYTSSVTKAFPLVILTVSIIYVLLVLKAK